MDSSDADNNQGSMRERELEVEIARLNAELAVLQGEAEPAEVAARFLTMAASTVDQAMADARREADELALEVTAAAEARRDEATRVAQEVEAQTDALRIEARSQQEAVETARHEAKRVTEAATQHINNERARVAEEVQRLADVRAALEGERSSLETYHEELKRRVQELAESMVSFMTTEPPLAAVTAIDELANPAIAPAAAAVEAAYAPEAHEVEDHGQAELDAEPAADTAAEMDATPFVEPAVDADPEPTVEAIADPEPTVEPEATVDAEPVVEPKPTVEPEPTADAVADPEPTVETTPLALVEPDPFAGVEPEPQAAVANGPAPEFPPEPLAAVEDDPVEHHAQPEPPAPSPGTMTDAAPAEPAPSPVMPAAAAEVPAPAPFDEATAGMFDSAELAAAIGDENDALFGRAEASAAPAPAETGVFSRMPSAPAGFSSKPSFTEMMSGAPVDEAPAAQFGGVPVSDSSDDDTRRRRMGGLFSRNRGVQPEEAAEPLLPEAPPIEEGGLFGSHASRLIEQTSPEQLASALSDESEEDERFRSFLDGDGDADPSRDWLLRPDQDD